METTLDKATHIVKLKNTGNKRIGTEERFIKADSIDEIFSYMEKIKREVIGITNLIKFEDR